MRQREPEAPASLLGAARRLKKGDAALVLLVLLLRPALAAATDTAIYRDGNRRNHSSVTQDAGHPPSEPDEPHPKTHRLSIARHRHHPEGAHNHGADAAQPSEDGAGSGGAGPDGDLVHVILTWSRAPLKGDVPVNHTQVAQLTAPGSKHPPRPIRGITWLKPPARGFVYAKGVSCEELPEDVQSRVDCVEAPNAGGREAHTLLMHIARHYGSLPRFLVSLQDDNVGEEDHSRWIRRVNQWVEAGAGAWELSRQQPHSEEGCLCHIVEERPLAESGAHRLGRWLSTRYFSWDPDAPGAMSGPHRWPTGAEFLIPREAILRHPLSAYQGVLDSGIVSHTDHFGRDGQNCSPEVSKALEEDGIPCENPNAWAHALEKVWWLIL